MFRLTRTLPPSCVAAFGLALLTPLQAASQKKIVADFEDFGTWRMKGSANLKPGTSWPYSVGLASSDAAKGKNDVIGELKVAFDPASSGPFWAGYERSKMSQVSGFLDGIEWEANPNGLPVKILFQIEDSAGKKFQTKAIPLTGNTWQHYRLELTAENVPGIDECAFPARLKRIGVEASKPCEGSIYLDDVAITGRFTKKDRLSVTPMYMGLANLPDQNVVLKYRVRNALANSVSGKVGVEVKDFDGKSVITKEVPFTIDAAGETVVTFDVGVLPIGAYNAEVTAAAGDSKVGEEDPFGVFVPNNGRPNKHPMWFGVCDQSAWQGALENVRHLEWMKLLGADIDRVGMDPRTFEFQEGVIVEGPATEMFAGHAKAGVDVMAIFDGSPPWTQKTWKWRYPPDFYDKYEEHARNVGTFLKKFPNVTYVEFGNEPDLEFFHGTLDDYLKMMKTFRKALKETNPSVQLTTGGVTVKHPREKAGFSKGLFQSGDYDIAAYHAHGPVMNNQKNQEQVEAWLKEAGLDKHYFNTETGDRSLYTAKGRRGQAVTLVKKIVYCKSVPNFDAYFWFTLQDYWDMDPENDDSFGLVTSDNRPKPSFIAYNTLIRELANTKPMPADNPKVDGLTLYAFKKDDGRYVYAGWPVESRTSGVLWMKSKQAVEVAGIFGDVKKYAPLGDILPIPIGELPLYIAGATPGEPIQVCPPSEAFLQVDPEIRYTGSGSVSIPVRFRNPTKDELSGTLTLRNDKGETVAEQVVKAAAAQEVPWSPSLDPASLHNGSLSLDLKLAGDGQSMIYSFPVRLIQSYLVAKVPALGNDPAKWPAADTLAPITIDKHENVFEMAYDPNTPAWKGPSDLSATARLAHDGKGIRFQIAVTDDVPGPLQPKEKLWGGDDVQVAFGSAASPKFAILDLGQSTEGPAVWCSENIDPARTGLWKVPIKIEKKGTTTVYDVYLPFDQLGLQPSEADKNIRFSFSVNENDGKGRIRWMEWTPGIARDRALNSLGYGSLE